MKDILTKLNIFFRKLHRFMVIFIVILSIVMMITGTMLKYPLTSKNLVPFINLGIVGWLHSITSPFFAIVLSIMLITGVVMWVYPMLIRRIDIDRQD